MRVAWVLNRRPKDPDGDLVEQVEAQLAGLARMEAAPRRIELRGFEAADACEMVASMLPLPPDASEVEQLVAALKVQRELPRSD